MFNQSNPSLSDLKLEITQLEQLYHKLKQQVLAIRDDRYRSIGDRQKTTDAISKAVTHGVLASSKQHRANLDSEFNRNIPGTEKN